MNENGMMFFIICGLILAGLVGWAIDYTIDKLDKDK